MESMFELSVPWHEIALRAALIYLALLVLLRLSGKRTVGRFTPFDLLVLVILGDAVQGAMLADDTSVSAALVVVATLLLLNALVGYVSARNRRIDRMLEGTPTLLARNGRLYEESLRGANLSRADFREAMRKVGCTRIDDIRLGVLETDGEITIVTYEGEEGRTLQEVGSKRD